MNAITLFTDMKEFVVDHQILRELPTLHRLPWTNLTSAGDRQLEAQLKRLGLGTGLPAMMNPTLPSALNPPLPTVRKGLKRRFRPSYSRPPQKSLAHYHSVRDGHHWVDEWGSCFFRMGTMKETPLHPYLEIVKK